MHCAWHHTQLLRPAKNDMIVLNTQVLSARPWSPAKAITPCEAPETEATNSLALLSFFPLGPLCRVALNPPHAGLEMDCMPGSSFCQNLVPEGHLWRAPRQASAVEMHKQDHINERTLRRGCTQVVRGNWPLESLARTAAGTRGGWPGPLQGLRNTQESRQIVLNVIFFKI